MDILLAWRLVATILLCAAVTGAGLGLLVYAIVLRGSGRSAGRRVRGKSDGVPRQISDEETLASDRRICERVAQVIAGERRERRILDQVAEAERWVYQRKPTVVIDPNCPEQVALRRGEVSPQSGRLGASDRTRRFPR